MRIYLALLVFVCNVSFSQLPKISLDWEKEAFEQFEIKDFDEFIGYDFSKIISNQLRIDRDPWSTYVGVFGTQNRRIDFHLNAKKISNTKYSINGKSKLGDNIRELTGEINLRAVLKTPWIASILIFDYVINEPGDRNGDGSYVGIGSVTFQIDYGSPRLFWSEAGDFREYNNMFVGVWNRYNSDISRECIFSFHPSGTHTKLPFREYLYKEFEEDDECKCYYEIRDEFREYGWENYDDNDIYKDYWWKNKN